MHLVMTDWTVTVPPQEILGHVGDHLSRTLTIQTDQWEGWTFKLDMARGGVVNVAELSLVKEGVLQVELTAAMLDRAGTYEVQVRGMSGEKVRHSNIFLLRVDRSLNGDRAFPDPLPSEFAQAERRIWAAVERAEQAALRAEAAGGGRLATPEEPGLVRVGDGLSVDGDGTLSVNELTEADVEALFGASEEDVLG